MISYEDIIKIASDGELASISTDFWGSKEMAFTSPINWDTLRISPQSIDKPSAKEKKKSDKQADTSKPQESGTDLPWNA